MTPDEYFNFTLIFEALKMLGIVIDDQSFLVSVN